MISITVKTLVEHPFELLVDPSISVNKLKEMIQSKTLIPCEMQKLYNGIGGLKMAIDTNCLTEYDVKDGSVICVIMSFNPPPGMKLRSGKIAKIIGT